VTDALEMLMNLADIVDNENRRVETYDDDPDGSETLKLLKQLESVTSRLVGTKPRSLGLHPFVYFYTSRGRHYMPLMIGMFSIVADKIKNNDSDWFKKFTFGRKIIEELLIEHKTIITLLISAAGSKQRIAGAKRVLEYLIDTVTEGDGDVTPDKIAGVLNLQSRLYSIQSRPGSSFSDDAKSSAFLREALKSALRCPICGGYMDPAKSASYDHVIRRQDGGDGSDDNCQITHPYCNSGIKN
jgi:hypothetical protein